MKVAFISRATLYSSPGGDTTQVDETASGLRRLGVGVDIFRTDEKIDYTAYDLLHFFNIIRPADILPHIQKAMGKPYLVSTIYVQYGEYERSARGGMAGMLSRILDEDKLEYLKAVIRWVKNGERVSSSYYLLKGHRQSVRYVAQRAACLLPNSASEYRRFSRQYNIDTRYRVVPNGISKTLVTRQYPKLSEYTDAILCMGRIEGRKNQLRLLQALKGSAYRLFIHGKASPNNQAYYQECVAIADDKLKVSSWLESDKLYAAYGSAKVHVLPSYFETTGLSSLEAAVMGCNIVVTDKGDTRDYFGDDAFYCDPDDTASIRTAIDVAFNAPYSEAFRDRILREFTWGRAAEETLYAYQQVLSTSQETV